MKNITKRIICMLLALTCAFVLVSCGGEDADSSEKKNSGEEDARLVAENFMDAFVELDFDEMKKYVDDEAAVEEIESNLDMSAILAGLPSELSAFESDFEGLANSMIDKFTSTLEYEITDVEEDGDNYVFAVQITMADLADVEDLFTNAFEDQLINEVTTEVLESGVITETSTEEEIYEVLVDKIVEKMESAINGAELETVTEEQNIVVVESDGEWVIDTAESDL